MVDTDVSEEHAAFFFRVMESLKMETLMILPNVNVNPRTDTESEQ